jgi:predicted ester cyclase
VVNRTTFSGTHQGEFQGIAPTGKRITITSISVSRITNGKVVEDWTVLDMLGMLQQLGVVPTPGQAR